MLNEDLSRRVAEREAQLREAFEALRRQREEQAAAAERQRIMRDIHDGVGSQLVGLLSLVRRTSSDAPQIEEHVKTAIDELRVAVDSMQPVDDDLAAVLATLRHRLEPRLQAAGIRSLWQVEALPPMPQLTPQVVLHLQRLLLEAFTNVIRHASAGQVVVEARSTGEPAQLELMLSDDGVGIGEAAARSAGHGLANMLTRAEAIGATLRVEAVAEGGTRVTLRWPIGTGTAFAGAPAPGDRGRVDP
jgi:hypothetical protein